MSNIGSISSRAMLCTLSISQWSARKLDMAASKKTTSDAGASSDAARVNKFLLAGNDKGLKIISEIATSARQLVYEMTLPWEKKGASILSVDLWPRLNAGLTQKASEFREAVERFGAIDYVHVRTQARFSLGNLFDEADYPSPSKIIERFSFSYSFDPIPDQGDFRVSLGDADIEMIKKDIERRTSDRIAAAMRGTWQRLYDKVQHIADTLPRYESGEQKKLFDSMLSNVVDLVEILPGLNIGNDPALTVMTDRVRAELVPIKMAALKTQPGARDAATKSAVSILAAMTAHLSQSDTDSSMKYMPYSEIKVA